MVNIQSGRHYEISSVELATWLKEQAPDSWWNVDGDPLLTGHVWIPCPSDELAEALSKIDRPLLVEASNESDAHGQVIDAAKIGSLASRIGSLSSHGPHSPWTNDRFFCLCWKGEAREWFLLEDSVSARQFLEDAAPRDH